MKNKKLSAIITFALLVSSTSYVSADDIYSPIPQSKAPLAENVIIKNNYVGTSDILTFNKLLPGDKVSVYMVPDPTELSSVTTATVASDGTSVIIRIPQLTQKKGSIYVTVINDGSFSTATRVSTLAKLNYVAEVTPSINALNMTTTNNTGYPKINNPDIVDIVKLSKNDKIAVYADDKKKVLIGKVNIGNATEGSIKVPQLGKDGGFVYVAVQRGEADESVPTKVKVDIEAVTPSPAIASIAITNNAGSNDTVVVTGLTRQIIDNEGGVVNVYADLAGKILLGTQNVAKGVETALPISIAQLGQKSGSLYVTVTTARKLESLPTKVNYDAELQSTAPDKIEVVNNIETVGLDTITVTGLNAIGDKVNVYSDAAGKLLIGTAISDISGTAVVSVPQLGTKAGVVYITVTQAGKSESSATKTNIGAEPITSSPATSNILITNNIGTPDNISLKNLAAGDIVNVYGDATGKMLIGKSIASNLGTVSIDVAQLGQASGAIYITVKNIKKLESAPTKITFLEETKPVPIDPTNVTITNNILPNDDNILVSGLTANDIVNVYADIKGKALIGTIDIDATGTGTIDIPQLGQLAGSVYLTLISASNIESLPTKVDYFAEPRTKAPDASKVRVINNIGTNDIITIKNVTTNDTVNVYSDAAGKILIGTTTAVGTPAIATINITQLGAAAGNIYVSATTAGKLESTLIKVSYLEEIKTVAPLANSIEVTNNMGITNDFMKIDTLIAGDIVNVYSDATGKKMIGTVTSNDVTATVNGLELGQKAGVIYVKLISGDKSESLPTKVVYGAEPKTTSPDIANIKVTNSIGIVDNILIGNLTDGDKIKVYADAAGKILLGEAIAINESVSIDTPQLGQLAGYIYITVTTTDATLTTDYIYESDLAKVAYKGEVKTIAPAITKFIITNNLVGTSDTVLLSGILPTDIVNIYSDAAGKVLIGTNSNNLNKLNPILIPQLGEKAGSIYVAVTNLGKLESTPTKVAFDGETKTISPDPSSITAINNIQGTDVITVSDLLVGDIVNIYADATGKVLLGTGLENNSKAIINVLQLGQVAGIIYVTVTNSNKLESIPTKVAYGAEIKTTMLDVKNVVVANNILNSDTITVNNLVAGDIVNVFSDALGKTLLGTATESNNTAVINVPQLGQLAGNIYITVKNSNKLESSPIKVGYIAETKTDTLVIKKVNVVANATINDYEAVIDGLTTGSGKIIVVNSNIGSTPDIVSIYGVIAGTSLNVYSDASRKNLLGTVIADVSGAASLNVAQLGQAAGNIYISLTNPGKLESNVTKVTYSPELMVTPTDVTNIEVEPINKIGTNDELLVNGLKLGDKVNVYADTSKKVLLATLPSAKGISDESISVSLPGQLSGFVYVTVTSLGIFESSVIKVPYSAETKTTSLDINNINVTNNTDSPDIIVVSALMSNSTVKVYSDAAGKKQIATGILPLIAGSGAAISISVPQLGQTAGSIYMTVTRTGSNESLPTKVAYKAENITSTLAIQNITLSNKNASMDDIEIAFTSLESGDIVNVYADSAGKILMTSRTVPANATSLGYISESTLTQQPFNLSLGQATGNIYITVKSIAKLESIPLKVNYLAELKTVSPAAANVKIINSIGQSDSIEVNGLKAGDIVKVYSDAAGKILKGTAIASNATATINLSLGQIAGTLYVSVTSTGMFESVPTKIAYAAEIKTASPVIKNITIKNNIGVADTITVNNLVTGDIVNVYSDAAGKILIGTAAEVSGIAAFSVTQLGKEIGNVYVTVKSQGILESVLTKVAYVAEIKTASPALTNIKVTNNIAKSDQVAVSGLISGDKVRVYSDAAGKILIGAADESNGVATVNIVQLGKVAGTIYVTVTSIGKNESLPTKVTVLGEAVTTAPVIANIKITNNKLISDIVTVANLKVGDIVTVYADAAKKVILGKGTTSTVSIHQLGQLAGSVYVTITSINKLESIPTKVNFIKE